MLRREFQIVLGAKATWLIAALAGLFVGHSFVLAVDLFSAGSRSVQSGGLMAREFDPLLGIVRPTLGGVYVSLSLLAPLVAVRSISVEKERRSLRVLLLQTAAPMRLLLCKYLASCAGVALLFLPVLGCLGMWRATAGHLDATETAVALLGYGFYLFFLCAIGCAAATWTKTLAQAAALTLLCVLFSFGIDAAEGFAALSWLSWATDFSLTPHVVPFERGLLFAQDCAWFLCLSLGALAIAALGVRFDWPPWKRALGVLGALLFTALLLRGSASLSVGYDGTQERRNSLQADIERALQGLGEVVSVAVFFDKEDARRSLLVTDVLTPLRLARKDVRVSFPLDEGHGGIGAAHDEQYGKVRVCVGARCKDSYSTQRKEVMTVLFECAGRGLPAWRSTNYHGYPHVVEGRTRNVVLGVSYVGFPGLLGGAGMLLTRKRRRK